MSLNELLPTVKELSYREKLWLMEWLTAQMTEENISQVSPDIEYPVWSPHDSPDAAAKLAAFLEQEKKNR